MQMAALGKQAAARAAVYDEVLADIRAKVADYGFNERDIFGRPRGAQATSSGGVVLATRDAKTGVSWSGRGRTSNWIKDATFPFLSQQGDQYRRQAASRSYQRSRDCIAYHSPT